VRRKKNPTYVISSASKRAFTWKADNKSTQQ